MGSQVRILPGTPNILIHKIMLQFDHSIPVTVRHDTAQSVLRVFVNQEQKFERVFEAGTHSHNIDFTHSYVDGSKNSLRIEYDGKQESESRLLEIKSITINKVGINVYNASYSPRFDQGWWATLDNDAKQNIKDKVHGNNGNHFGWYGDIEWHYFTGKDKKSKMKVRTASDYDNTDDILGMKMQWVYADVQTHNPWELNDKLL